MMGMPIEVRDRWVAALRSGEYEQGMDQLKDNDKFCCLGVLCDVVGFDLDSHDGQGGTWAFATGIDWSGEPPILLDLLEQPVRNKLANMNDNGSTFTEIADHIEREVPVS
jgi:hypothetical protein